MYEHSGRKKRVRRWTNTVGERRGLGGGRTQWGEEGEEVDEHSGRKKRVRRWTNTVGGRRGRGGGRAQWEEEEG